MKIFFLLLLFFCSCIVAAEELDYYLPQENISYNEDIPTPKDVLGYPVGKWHVSSHELIYYAKIIATISPRITLIEYARSYEDKQLVVLVITAPENHEKIEEIKQKHQLLRNPENTDTNLENLPLVVYIGNSIHGNEPSGSNAALAKIYYLAAAQSDDVDAMLKNTVILLDPTMNPDGLSRFASWVNVHKSKSPIADPMTREHNEVWPGGRTNHYWFDLNRDWLFAQHPESRGRATLFQEWQPNILTDHHEMGTDATYFFQPGAPTRSNPLTPKQNFAFTQRIAEYHAKRLDTIGSLYFTKERFDDFYYGKGSSFPDAQGCIGILFEQASSRGHLQNSIHGPLSFPFTIRNQVQTMFSTLEAAQAMRTELLQYKKQFYVDAWTQAKQDPVKAYVVGSNDSYRLYHFAEILERNKIDSYQLLYSITLDGQEYAPNQSLIIPVTQLQYRLLKSLFEKRTTFEDNIFYDVSTWNLPLAFNLPFSEIKNQQQLDYLQGKKQKTFLPQGKMHANTDKIPYAYVFEWDGFYTPRALHRLLENNIYCKVATKNFTVNTKGIAKEFSQGTILIPTGIQQEQKKQIATLVQKITKEDGIDVYSVDSGFSIQGMDLGSDGFVPLNCPKILMLVGDGVSSYEAGEVWHLLDHRFNMPVTKVDIRDAGYLDMNQYNTLILVHGSYSALSLDFISTLKVWHQNGGNIIATRSAISWVAQQGFASIQFISSQNAAQGRLPYATKEQNDGAQVTGGAIVAANIDTTHPIAYGYKNNQVSLFRSGNTCFSIAKNPYATPLQYTETPLVCGYMSAENQQKLKSTAAVIISGKGRGKTICINDNPNFRAFWLGTNKLFMNAIFFGQTIESGSVERE